TSGCTVPLLISTFLLSYSPPWIGLQKNPLTRDHDLVFPVHDVQDENFGCHTAKQLHVFCRKCTAHSQFRDLGIGNHEFRFVVTIEFCGNLGKRRALEDHYTAAPT